MSRKRFEIGSEFWLEEPVPRPVSFRDGVYTVSGRTAIDFIIQDILATRQIQNVLMPAWGCDSMIAPFIDRGIKVDLYDIRFENRLDYLIDTDHQTDIFYVNNYFGYENTINIDVVRLFKSRGAIILYDCTHSFFMDNDPYLSLSDYNFVSIRKWIGVVGGAAVDGVKKKSLKPCLYLDSRITAMRMKKAFMDGDDTVDKQEFLKLYSDFGYYLTEDYRDYAMDDLSYAIYKSTDMVAVRDQRIANAQYLHHHLNLQFLSPLTSNVCPLFVPVLFKNKEERDRVRNKLIKDKIFCPIHWPKNQYITPEMEVNQIFDTELSLICDQRYGIADMQKIIENIQE